MKLYQLELKAQHNAHNDSMILLWVRAISLHLNLTSIVPSSSLFEVELSVWTNSNSNTSKVILLASVSHDSNFVTVSVSGVRCKSEKSIQFSDSYGNEGVNPTEMESFQPW